MSNFKFMCLYNADDEIIGYFSDHAAETAARKEWEDDLDRRRSRQSSSSEMRCVAIRSIETPIVSAELEDVDAGDGDRMDYVYNGHGVTVETLVYVATLVSKWLDHGAASVEVQRFLVNRYRRPDRSNRDADLSGPQEAAGVLYMLRIKAPK